MGRCSRGTSDLQIVLDKESGRISTNLLFVPNIFKTKLSKIQYLGACGISISKVLKEVIVIIMRLKVRFVASPLTIYTLSNTHKQPFICTTFF